MQKTANHAAARLPPGVRQLPQNGKGDRMFGWILKTDWSIEEVMEVYSRKRRRLARLAYMVPRRMN